MPQDSRGQIQIELSIIVVRRIALRVALDLDVAQVVAGHVAGDVDPVEARGLEAGKPRIDLAHRVLQLLQVLVDQGVGADLVRDLVLAALVGMSMPYTLG